MPGFKDLFQGDILRTCQNIPYNICSPSAFKILILCWLHHKMQNIRECIRDSYVINGHILEKKRQKTSLTDATYTFTLENLLSIPLQKQFLARYYNLPWSVFKSTDPGTLPSQDDSIVRLGLIVSVQLLHLLSLLKSVPKRLLGFSIQTVLPTTINKSSNKGLRIKPFTGNLRAHGL